VKLIDAPDPKKRYRNALDAEHEVHGDARERATFFGGH